MKVLFFSSNFQGVRKISVLLVCMFFVFVFVVSPIKVKAEAFPIPPLWLPMNPYNAQGLEGNYVLLNDEQKKIVHEVLGAVNTVYLGMGGYVLANPVLGVQSTREFYQKYGSTFLNTFWSQIMGTSRAMTDFVGSTIYKASTYESYSEYEQDTAPSVSSSDHKYFQISPELTVAFKNWYRANGGVEDWQASVKPFIFKSFTWRYNSNYSYLDSDVLSYVNQNNTNNYPVMEWNNHSGSSYTNGYAGISIRLQSDIYIALPSELCLFINTSNNHICVYTLDGTNLNGKGIYFNPCACLYNGSLELYSYPWSSSFPDYTYDPAQYNSYLDIARYAVTLNYTSRYESYCLFDFASVCNRVFVGADWSSREEIYNIDDLNIGNTDSQYIQNIDNVGYVDINTLIGQIADEVVNLREVVEESVLVKDGDSAIPYADSLQVAIDKYINQPDSGVVIPVDLFGGLTGANGPVSYLWFMTKPLVSYTGDLLGLLTLEGDGTFQFTGLGYIVIGVVTVGIIGGLVNKCLL